MKKLDQIKQIITDLESDKDKFYNKKNSTAGVRIRKAMLEIKNLASEVRKEVSELKSN